MENKIEKLVFDDGLKRIDINGNGILYFNPSDLNVYQRLMALLRDIPTLEKTFMEKVQAIGAENAELKDGDIIEPTGKVLDVMREFDVAIKSRLSDVFGSRNDFDVLFAGINLMSPASNGEYVVTNFLHAITPIVEEGIDKHRKLAASEAVAAARLNREQRRAMGKKGRR